MRPIYLIPSPTSLKSPVSKSSIKENILQHNENSPSSLNSKCLRSRSINSNDLNASPKSMSKKLDNEYAERFESVSPSSKRSQIHQSRSSSCNTNRNHSNVISSPTFSPSLSGSFSVNSSSQNLYPGDSLHMPMTPKTPNPNPFSFVGTSSPFLLNTFNGINSPSNIDTTSLFSPSRIFQQQKASSGHLPFSERFNYQSQFNPKLNTITNIINNNNKEKSNDPNVNYNHISFNENRNMKKDISSIACSINNGMFLLYSFTNIQSLSTLNLKELCLSFVSVLFIYIVFEKGVNLNWICLF